MTSQERMLEAAIAVIEEHGEAGVRVDEIAATAEVAKPSLYHFFGSRDGLVAAAQAERYRRSLNVGLDEVFERLDDCTSAEEFKALVRAWLANFSEDAARRRRATRLEVIGSSVSRPELQAEVARASRRAADRLSEVGRIAMSRGWMLQSTDLDLDDVSLWLVGVWNQRYLAEITGDPSRIAGWDVVSQTAVFRLLFGSD